MKHAGQGTKRSGLFPLLLKGKVATCACLLRIMMRSLPPLRSVRFRRNFTSFCSLYASPGASWQRRAPRYIIVTNCPSASSPAPHGNQANLGREREARTIETQSERTRVLLIEKKLLLDLKVYYLPIRSSETDETSKCAGMAKATFFFFGWGFVGIDRRWERKRRAQK